MILLTSVFDVLCRVLVDAGFAFYALPFVCAGLVGFVLIQLSRGGFGRV